MDAIKIEGLRELRAAMRQADTKAGSALRIGLNTVADVVAAEARQQVPRRSGRLADSIRARSTQLVAQVVMGTARVPYAGFIEFGGTAGRHHSVHRPFLPGGRYLWPAVTAQRAGITAAMTEVLDRVHDEIGLT